MGYFPALAVPNSADRQDASVCFLADVDGGFGSIRAPCQTFPQQPAPPGTPSRLQSLSEEGNRRTPYTELQKAAFPRGRNEAGPWPHTLHAPPAQKQSVRLESEVHIYLSVGQEGFLKTQRAQTIHLDSFETKNVGLFYTYILKIANRQNTKHSKEGIRIETTSRTLTSQEPPRRFSAHILALPLHLQPAGFRKLEPEPGVPLSEHNPRPATTSHCSESNPNSDRGQQPESLPRPLSSSEGTETLPHPTPARLGALAIVTSSA